MTESPEAWGIVLKILEYIFRILVVVVIPATGWLIREIFKIREKFAVFDQRTCDFENAVKEKLKELPGDRAIHELALAIERLNGQVAGMGEATSRLERVVARHEDFLLKFGGGR